MSTNTSVPMDTNTQSREYLSGVLLMICAFLAMLVSNSPISLMYNHILDTSFIVKIGDLGVDKPIILWINDGLMVIFFLLVGLELKREIVCGELRDIKKSALSIGGAIGGMVVPAIVFLWVARHTPGISHAWAIPMATDIAFALGMLALFGKRVPLELKLFLMTLAIIDDLGAILVIALFHTKELSMISLFLAGICFTILMGLNLFRVSRMSMYILFGLVMWLCVLKSGFHATIAGVLLAMSIPVEDGQGRAMLESLEHDLQPLVIFVVLPVFAFANAGIPLHEMGLTQLVHPLVMAIVAGLVLGKLVGIFSFTYATKKLFNIKSSFNNLMLVGVSCLCGVGFTMSLFIASLSFAHDNTLLNLSRLGILLGSGIALIIGLIALNYALPKKAA